MCGLMVVVGLVSVCLIPVLRQESKMLSDGSNSAALLAKSEMPMGNARGVLHLVGLGAIAP